MEKAVTVQQARDLILSIPHAPTKCEIVTLSESCGRVLAEDIYAKLAIPPFDRSPFDGYAFRGEDTSGASEDTPVTLKITEEIPAGAVPTIDITEGLAAKILTGAPIPKGADATIKYEETSYTDKIVTFRASVEPGANIVFAGDDVEKGDIIGGRHNCLPGGRRIVCKRGNQLRTDI